LNGITPSLRDRLCLGRAMVGGRAGVAFVLDPSPSNPGSAARHPAGSAERQHRPNDPPKTREPAGRAAVHPAPVPQTPDDIARTRHSCRWSAAIARSTDHSPPPAPASDLLRILVREPIRSCSDSSGATRVGEGGVGPRIRGGRGERRRPAIRPRLGNVHARLISDVPIAGEVVWYPVANERGNTPLPRELPCLVTTAAQEASVALLGRKG
jgi:hypothetical protein